MLTLSEIRRGPIAAALALLPAKMESPQAEVMLLAIHLQEDPRQTRHQVDGPARSLWQAEKGGGMVHGVPRHPATSDLAAKVCAARDVETTDQAIYIAIERDDVLAAALARLLLYTDPARLPALGEEEKAWDLYLRTWRPGAAKRDYDGLRRKWSGSYAKALECVTCSA